MKIDTILILGWKTFHRFNRQLFVEFSDTRCRHPLHNLHHLSVDPHKDRFHPSRGLFRSKLTSSFCFFSLCFHVFFPSCSSFSFSFHFAYYPRKIQTAWYNLQVTVDKALLTVWKNNEHNYFIVILQILNSSGGEGKGLLPGLFNGKRIQTHCGDSTRVRKGNPGSCHVRTIIIIRFIWFFLKLIFITYIYSLDYF